MYGQDDIQIIYADALANNARIFDSHFKVLIANPPYSVKGFLETLTDNERSNYELSAYVSDISKNNSIETFFIERAKQLLASDGVAAIILPASVLSNGKIYIACREILLKYFEIVSIVELGSGTFGKTGTSTATLFLKRRNTNPDISEHYLNRVNSWFNGDSTKDIVFDDTDYVLEYCEHCGIDFKEYTNWLKGSDHPTADIFAEYENRAQDNAKYKAIKKKKITKKYTDTDKETELKTFIDTFIKDCEKEKLYYFLLCKNNSCPVVVVQSPKKAGKEDKNLTKAFLGYEWSGAKGSEGIKYLGVNNAESDEDELIVANKGIKSINTPLFDPININNPNKINHIIRENFTTGSPVIPSDLAPYVNTYNLWDMLDFSRVDFDKAIRTSGIESKITPIESKYPIVSVDKLAKISRGASPRPIEKFLTEDVNGINWIKIGDVAVGEKYITHTAEKITNEGAEKSRRVKPGDFIVSNSMSVGRPYISKIDGCIHDGWLLLSEISSDIDTEYFYYVLSSEIAQKQLFDSARGGVVKNLNISRMSSIKIPVPPKSIQTSLVNQLNDIENQISSHKATINSLIANQYAILNTISGDKVKISSITSYITARINFSSIQANKYITTDNMLQSFGGITENTNIPNVDKVIEYKIGDILVSNIRPYLKKIYFSTQDGGCSPDVLVFRVNDKKKVLPKYLYYLMRTNSFFEWAMSNVKGMKMPRGKKETISSYEVPLIPLDEQEKIVKLFEDNDRKIYELQNKITTLLSSQNNLINQELI